MKKRLKFVKEIDGYAVYSKDEILGYIGFDRKWKKFVFAPFGDTLYSTGCLLEMSEFMNKQSKESINND